MQQGLTRLSHWLGYLCRLIAGVALLALLSVTILDVGLRYLGRLTGGGGLPCRINCLIQCGRARPSRTPSEEARHARPAPRGPATDASGSPCT